MLVDLCALQDEAEAAGGELSFRKLLRGLADNREVVDAQCFAREDAASISTRALVAGGFELHLLPDAATAAVAMTTHAWTLIGKVDTLVIAPMQPALQPLIEALVDRDDELRLEIAGFGAQAPAGTHFRRLGRECLFVP